MYKTPGVYVEEIPKFPPSIAPVETAIPAFIGYTERTERNGEDLIYKPVRIESIAEFEEIFGGGPPQDVTVWLDAGNNFVKAEADAHFYLYDSLRMFYANGGGNCYIVSTGDYGTGADQQHFLDGIKALAREDEPTILLFPDAVALPNTTDLYNVQVEALTQCANLMDRVVLCDTKYMADFKNAVDEFRNNIGINNLKYGAAYGPWINSSLPRNLAYRNLTLQQYPSNSPLLWSDLTADAGLKALLADLGNVQTSVDSLTTDEAGLSGGSQKLEERLNFLKTAPQPPVAGNSNAVLQGKLQAASDFLAAIIDFVKTQEDNAPVVANSVFKLKSDLQQYRKNSALPAKLTELAAHHNALYQNTPAGSEIALFNDTNGDYIEEYLADTLSPATYNPTTNKFTGTLPDYNAAYAADADDVARAARAWNATLAVIPDVINLFRYYAKTVASYESTLNKALRESFGLYKTLSGKAAEALSLLPASGAVAGAYATVDRERGVWKAPANVSLNAVIAPAEKISHEQQAEFNVDVNAGKSVNIIRSFTGRGPAIIWGSRTLAGNDNEWRYVPVRRFFNFVEESVKKATEQFVFEPNDANTWVRVQAMIENFLTTLWRQGALQGVKPEHAFYVAVGLGKTMTPLDILEGRMIIEIGMAAVRPAEFIILRFSHKMAES